MRPLLSLETWLHLLTRASEQRWLTRRIKGHFSAKIQAQGLMFLFQHPEASLVPKAIEGGLVLTSTMERIWLLKRLCGPTLQNIRQSDVSPFPRIMPFGKNSNKDTRYFYWPLVSEPLGHIWVTCSGFSLLKAMGMEGLMGSQDSGSWGFEGKQSPNIKQ